ncbi:hypothetical protein ACEQPO_28700 [Bacillus sp. SL00103]
MMANKDFDCSKCSFERKTQMIYQMRLLAYGKDAGKTIQRYLVKPYRYLVIMSKRDASGDKEAKEKSGENLDAYRMKQAKFLDQATDGRLKAADLEAGLKMHIDELIKNIYVIP